MTSPFDSKAYPAAPPVPNSAPEGYVTPASPNGRTAEPIKSSSQIAAMRNNLWEFSLQKVVEALVGAFVPGLGPAFDQLFEWGQQIANFVGNIFDTIVDAINTVLGPIFDIFDFQAPPTPGEVWAHVVQSVMNPGSIPQNIVNGLTNSLNGIGNTIQTIIDHIVKAATGVFNPGRAIGEFIDRVGDLLNKISPLNLFNAFGVMAPHQIGKLPAGAVADTEQNLVAEGAFRDLVTVVEGQGWEWDGNEGRSIGGSVKVIADGEQNELVSNLIPVSKGDKLRLSAYVKWASLNYTGSDPIALGITGYEYDDLTKSYTELESFDIVSIGAPPFDSALWSYIEGTYEVPDTGSIPDAVRVRLKISQDLNAGTVWWDEVAAVKTNLVRDDVVPGIGEILVNAVNGLENLADGNWTHEDFLAAMFGQNQSTIGLATRLAYLESLQTQDNQAADLFERANSTDLGGDWALSYSGGGGGRWSIPNGHDASWTESGSGTREVTCRYLKPGDETSDTDNQKVIAVLGSQAQKQYGGVGRNTLYGRMSADGQNAVYCHFAADGWVSIWRRLAGVNTELSSVKIGARGPSSGSTLALVCGTADGPRNFEVHINGQAILTASDATSQVGVAFRGWGHGARAQGYAQFIGSAPFFVSGQASPGKLNSWAAVDA